MYIVVSRWQALPGHDQQFKEIGLKVRGLLRSQPGTKFIEAFPTGDVLVVVHAYSDEASYNEIIANPSGAFAKALAETKLEDHGRWLDSQKGTTIT